jgi:hypothetical protein
LRMDKEVKKIRQKVNMIKRLRLNGCFSTGLKRSLFSTYILPLFA